MTIFKRYLFFTFLTFLAITTFSASLHAAVTFTQHRITIQRVQLKDVKGQWITIIEPDKVVDLETAEPGVSFFNNGRVPDGNYVNFRLLFQENATKVIKEISGKNDLAPAISIQRSSFIGVWFKYILPSEEISGASIYVDQTEITIPGNEIATSSFPTEKGLITTK